MVESVEPIAMEVVLKLWIPFILFVGWWLKKYTQVPNSRIPWIVLGVAVVANVATSAYQGESIGMVTILKAVSWGVGLGMGTVGLHSFGKNTGVSKGIVDLLKGVFMNTKIGSGMLVMLLCVLLVTPAICAGDYDPRGTIIEGGYGVTLIKDTTPADGIETDKWENAGWLGIGVVIRPEIDIGETVLLSDIGFTYRYLEGAFHGFGGVFNVAELWGVSWFMGPELTVETTEGPTTVGGNVRLDGFFQFLSRPWYFDVTGGYMPGDRWILAVRVNAVATAIE